MSRASRRGDRTNLPRFLRTARADSPAARALAKPSVATATTATHSATAGRSLARKINMLRHHAAQCVTVRPHGVAGQRGSLPRFHADEIGIGAAGKSGGSDRGEHEAEASFHL